MIPMDNPGKPKVEYCSMGVKQRHASKKGAKAQLASLMNNSAKNRKGRTGVYRCDWCDGWHVGRR